MSKNQKYKSKISQRNINFVDKIKNTNNPVLSQEERNNLTNKFNSLTSNQIEKMFKDSLSVFSNSVSAKGDTGWNNEEVWCVDKNIWEISNFKYNNQTKELSFVIKQGWQSFMEVNGTKANSSIIVAFEFKNIKIELDFTFTF